MSIVTITLSGNQTTPRLSQPQLSPTGQSSPNRAVTALVLVEKDLTGHVSDWATVTGLGVWLLLP